MSLSIQILPSFNKQAKRLAKKHKSLAKDLQNLQEILTANPNAGIELSNNCYKIRIANSSSNKGKSGGFRIIYYYLSPDENLYLMTIYSKAEHGNIEEAKLQEILLASGLL